MLELGPFINHPLEQLSFEHIIDPETRDLDGIPFSSVPAPSSGTFSGYSGTEITAVLTIEGQPYSFAELHTISYSTHREKALVRSLGLSNAKGYTYGPRTIAGSLVFIQFDRDMIYRAMRNLHTGARVLPDELPPFHVSVLFRNSPDGSQSVLNIYNVTIVDNGQVMSIEDLVTENTMSYFATGIDLLRPMEGKGFSQKRKLITVPKLTPVLKEEPPKDDDRLYTDNHRITIRVTDIDNNPISNVRLIINDTDTGEKTDAKGIASVFVPISTETAQIELVHNGKKYLANYVDMREYTTPTALGIGWEIAPDDHYPKALRGQIVGRNLEEITVLMEQTYDRVTQIPMDSNGIFAYSGIHSRPRQITILRGGTKIHEITEIDNFYRSPSDYTNAIIDLGGK